MWVVFNKNGQLVEKLEGGSAPRVGDTSFVINCVFKDIDNVSIKYPNATIMLQKPGIEPEFYPSILMGYSSAKEYDGDDGTYLKNGEFYNTFYFDFSELNYSTVDEDIVLLDTAGEWKAIIKLLNPNNSSFVQGTVSFQVEGSSLDDETSLPIYTVLSNIESELAKKLNLTGGQMTGPIYMGWYNSIVFGDGNSSVVGPTIYSDTAGEGVLTEKAKKSIVFLLNGVSFSVPEDETSDSVLATRDWSDSEHYTKDETYSKDDLADIYSNGVTSITSNTLNISADSGNSRSIDIPDSYGIKLLAEGSSVSLINRSGEKLSTVGVGVTDKATKDADGNVISETYLKRSGGEMTGDVNFNGAGITANDGLSIMATSGGITLKSGGGSAVTVPTDETETSDIATRNWVGEGYYGKAESDSKYATITSVSEESVRAKEAEKSNSDAISSEASSRMKTDEELQESIDTEESERKTADGTLQDQIDNLKSRGRYLSQWDCVTGKPASDPTSLPYEYRSGDYFIVGNTGVSNKRPSGTSYTGEASETAETEDVSVDDVYYYDGSSWHLQFNTQKTVRFANIAGDPGDNVSLKAALDAKQGSLSAAQLKAADSGIDSDKVKAYDEHIEDKENPHGVTAEQLGLGNVDNTSDADKPISTATQTALDAKQDALTFATNAEIDALFN